MCALSVKTILNCYFKNLIYHFRFANIRETQQGKQEERMPFFSLVVPPWLEKKYPNFVQNLQMNQNRLVTPFDIHATFMTLLYPEDVPNEGDLSSRSISLFSKIPQEVCLSMTIRSLHIRNNSTHKASTDTDPDMFNTQKKIENHFII